MLWTKRQNYFSYDGDGITHHTVPVIGYSSITLLGELDYLGADWIQLHNVKNGSQSEGRWAGLIVAVKKEKKYPLM